MFILEGEKVLLHHHAKLERWMPPGGHLEPGETPAEAAVREAREETGLDIELIVQENLEIEHPNAKSFPRPYMCLLENLPDHQHIDMVYVARPLGGTLAPEMQWFDEEEVRQLCRKTEILPDVQEIIHHLFAARRASRL